MVGISLFVVAIVLLNKKLSWARRINPVLLTLAYMLETTILPVYTSDYLVLSSGAQFAFSFMVPMLVCETFAGMLLSWILIFGSLTIGLIRGIESEVNSMVLIGYWIVCFMMNFLIVKNMQNDMKLAVAQRIKLTEQRDEFHKILSSIPQGIMLASLKDHK